MHKLTPIALLFAAAAAHPATYVAKTSPVGLHAGAGTGKVLSSHPDLAACAAAAAKLAKVATYTCKASVAVTLAPAPVPTPPPPAPAPAPVPVPPPPAPAPPPAALPTDGFKACASEGGVCAVPQPANVIYGSNKTYTAPKPFVADVACNNATFGDPTPGAVKSCWSQPTGAATDTSGSDMGAAGPTYDATKVPPKALGSAEFRVRATDEIAPDSDSGAFRTSCTVAKVQAIDPIVFPGKIGQSHLHTFFGNVDVNENSTAESLLASGNSTCRGGIANRSAYWVPTMIDTATGTPVMPDDIGVYYKSGFTTGDKITRGVPEGLRFIAGNPASKGPPKPGDPFAYRYKCIGGPNKSNDQYGSPIPNCDAGAQIWQEIFFPQCWDGVNLDSPDHKSHMSYTIQVPDPTSTKGWFMHVCPASHPVILPQITFNVIYTVPRAGAALKWRLASDAYSTDLPGGFSAHGDWFNGWKHDVSEAWAKNCVMAKKDCHSHLLGDGRMIF